MKKIMLSGNIAYDPVYNEETGGVRFDLAVNTWKKGIKETEFYRIIGNSHFSSVLRDCHARKGMHVENLWGEPKLIEKDKEINGSKVRFKEIVVYLESIEFGYAKKEEPSQSHDPANAVTQQAEPVPEFDEDDDY